jgi:phosphotransferase system enzyme I (PtsI)
MTERKYNGLGISPGISIGKAFVLEQAKPVIWMHRVSEDMLDQEVQRLDTAIEKTKVALKEVIKQIAHELGDEHAYIFDAHMLMLQDPILVQGTHDFIRKKKVNAEYALQQVTNELSQTFSSFEDEYLRERGTDVLDVASRIQWHLSRPTTHDEKEPDEPSILFAHNLHPSKFASMDTKNVLGLAMDVGGMTTHTGLLAIAKGIPAVVGLHDASVVIRPGEKIILNGTDGLIIVNPTPETLEIYKRKQELYHQKETELLSTRDLPAITLDGQIINLYANVELKEEIDTAFNKYGAQAIGLYRSEYIFLSNPNVMPTESDHEEMYVAMLQAAGEKFVNLRTMDLGGEKNLESLEIGREPNPALGLRAIRYGLNNKSMLKSQLRGALRASTQGNLKIMIPMVSSLDEVREVKKIIEQCSIDLIKAGVAVNDEVDFGIMIEIPSAAIIADVLADEVDFVSVGTNDLIQYTLAIDRGNESVAHLYEPYHPAVLRILANIATKVHAAGKSLSMCGEMASDPIAAPLLIGMGYHELSMNPISIPIIKSVVRNVSYDLCCELAAEALTKKTASEVHQMLRDAMEEYYENIKDLKLGIPLKKGF